MSQPNLVTENQSRKLLVAKKQVEPADKMQRKFPMVHTSLQCKTNDRIHKQWLRQNVAAEEKVALKGMDTD